MAVVVAVLFVVFEGEEGERLRQSEENKLKEM